MKSSTPPVGVGELWSFSPYKQYLDLYFDFVQALPVLVECHRNMHNSEPRCTDLHTMHESTVYVSSLQLGDLQVYLIPHSRV